MTRYAAIIFVLLIMPVLGLQLGLAAGLPWGELAMGGAYPGVFPTPLRIAAVIQALILTGAATVVVARSGMAFKVVSGISRWLIWAVVALLAIGVVLNLITPSDKERLLWLPVAAGLFVTSLIVALRRSTP